MGSRVVRFAAAFFLLLYGFAKINGSQFTILDSELDKPMGQVSGFWLAWYFFGYSKIYGTFLALVQIAGAMLLTFRRTALLGAAVLTPMLANIVLIDIFYAVDLGALLVAVGLLCAMIWLLYPHFAALFALLLPVGPPERAVWAKWAVRIAMLAVACGFTYWAANYNNRNPTEIDGAWDVTRVEPAAATGIPSTIFFEYNRAGWVTFKFRDGTYPVHHFEMQREGKRLEMWQQWMTKGERIFEGVYRLSGNNLRVEGNWSGVGRVAVELAKR